VPLVSLRKDPQQDAGGRKHVCSSGSEGSDRAERGPAPRFPYHEGLLAYAIAAALLHSLPQRTPAAQALRAPRGA
jgi:hypothetical protein